MTPLNMAGSSLNLIDGITDLESTGSIADTMLVITDSHF